MKKKYYVITALTAYLIFMVAGTPAKMVTDYIDESAGITFLGVTGSIWHGHAHSIVVKPDIRLTDMNWTFHTWKLLIGQLALELDTGLDDHRIETQLAASVTGRIYIDDLKGMISAALLSRIIEIPLARLDGVIAMDIITASWKQGEAPVAEGQIDWTDAVVSVADTAALGDITILLSEYEPGLSRADIDNKGGEISITGHAQVTADENYAVDIRFSPTATASRSIKQSLGMFAKPQRNGDYLLQNSGPLSQTGIL